MAVKFLQGILKYRAGYVINTSAFVLITSQQHMQGREQLYMYRDFICIFSNTLKNLKKNL